MVLSIAACSNSSPEKSRFVEYAATIPPIQVPPGIKNPTSESYYPIPPIALATPFGTKPPLTPPGSQLQSQRNKVKLPPPRNTK
jgi:uncharacterized lipoprotein